MSDVSKQPSSQSFWLSVVGVIGCFLIFAVVLYIAYLPSRPTTVGQPSTLTEEERLEKGLLTPEERKQRLVELRGKEDAGLASYQWVDKEKGVVHLPVERAMELTVRDLQSSR